MYLNYKEDVAKYMISGSLHLSKKDFGFFNNLQYLIKDKGQVTSNQAKLFDKLLMKYQRQFKKNGYNHQNFIDLPWKSSVVESKQEFLDAKIYIQNDQICIKSPFNNNFVSNLRKQNPNFFSWDKTNKLYTADISTASFKQAIDLVTKFYKSVKLCPQLQSIFDEIRNYDSTNWNPTYVKNNDIYFIGSINQIIYDKILYLTLDDSPKTLFELSKLGVKVDDEIIKNDDFRRFAAEYKTVVDIESLERMVDWILHLNFDYVHLSRDIMFHKLIYKEISKLLEGKILYGSNVPAESVNIIKLSLTSSNSYRDIANNKTVLIRNSRPIEVT